MKRKTLIILLILTSIVTPAVVLVIISSGFQPPKTGYVVHFDFISDEKEARDLVRIAHEAGADVINVVPPAHVWENRRALVMLDAILEELTKRGMSFVFARIDASYPPDGRGERVNYLYDRILTEPGRLPDGTATTGYYLSMVGLEKYDRWMEDELRYYAGRYGRLPNLLGITIGPFCEPFSTERGNYLEYMRSTKRYEITQYTPLTLQQWHKWLVKNIGDISSVNREYGVHFVSMDQVPMPRNESDTRFGRPELAFFDFVRVFNDWFIDRYERCRRIWHESSGRDDVPLILQMNGAELEKIVRGRPSYMAFDIPGWIARADAVGLSIYTSSGFPDFAHAPIKSMVNMLALAADLDKDFFIMESGCEAPNIVLDPGELEFIGTVALSLRPRIFIYEFLKDKFNETYPSNPGKLVDAGGNIREPAFKALSALFSRIKSSRADPVPPALYVLFDPLAARGNMRLGEINAALYEISSSLPIRWVPKGSGVSMTPGVPVMHTDGSITPPNRTLSRLFQSVPPVDSERRGLWRMELIGALHSAFKR